MYEVERDYQFFHPIWEPDEMAIVDPMEGLYGDPDIAEQMAKEDREYVEALLNRPFNPRPFNPDDDF